MKKTRWSVLLLFVVFLFSSCVSIEDPKEGPVYSQNEIVNTDNFSFQIMGVTETQFINSIGDFKTENCYLVIEIKVTNNSQYDKHIASGEFTITNGKHTFDQLSTESYWYGNGKDIQGLSYGVKVKAGLSERFYTVFEVPSSVNDSKYTLTFKPDYKEYKILIDTLSET